MKSLLLIIVLAAATGAQSPDRWKGLVIDESTPENTIAILGKPEADKTDSFRVYKIEDWFTKSIREKKWRRLEYKNVEGFDKVILAFDTKLVFIELNPKKLDPDVLENAYGVPFTATFDKFERALNPGNVGRDSGRVQSYPVFYYLYAKAPKSILLAGVGNSSIGSLLGAKAINDDVGYPGKVAYLQIISRTLENRDGIETLK
ncbi:MAG: hypothetical protein DMF63_05350 [Acidobacteria bacterium]|nr:MAG: hypothetical protein DMF63_05350 [Acidobacteriota bacterium]